MIERVPPISIHAAGTVPTKPTSGEITLKDVSFSYPARPDVPVFRSFSLVIEAGAEVALVGASGSGKSTVIQLIERFYDPAAGAVCLDGVDIRQLSLPWYRSQVRRGASASLSPSFSLVNVHTSVRADVMSSRRQPEA